MPALALRLEDTEGDLNQEAARSSALRIDAPISATSGWNNTILADTSAGDTSEAVAPVATVAESGGFAREQLVVGSRTVSLLANVMRVFKRTCAEHVDNTAPISDLADAVVWDGPMCGLLSDHFGTVQALLTQYPQKFGIQEKDGMTVATALPGSDVADWWVADTGPVPAPVRADMKDEPAAEVGDWDRVSGSPSPRLGAPPEGPKTTPYVLGSGWPFLTDIGKEKLAR